VDQETWDAVQARLAVNAKVGQERAAGPQYPLTGLIWCADCQKRVHGQPDQTGKYPFYHCPYCGKSKSNRKVERILRRLLAAVPVGTEAIAARGRSDQSQVKRAQERAAAVARRIERLHERSKRLTLGYADGTIAPSDYAAAIAETEQELTALQGEQETLGRQQGTDASIVQTVRWLQQIESWTALLDAATIEQRNRVYRECFSQVVLDYGANTLAVMWAPALARLLGRSEDVETL
jgi:hypothetical protein